MPHIFYVIPNILYTLLNILRDVYILSLWIGWAITTVIVGSIKFLVSSGNYVVAGLCVLSEDFVSFLEDLGEVLEKFALVVSDEVYVVYKSCAVAVFSVVSAIISAPTFIYEMVTSLKFVSYIVHLFILVKDALLLLGICIWEAFALTFTALAFINEAPYIVLLFLARAVDRTIYDAFSLIETYWFKSMCGLCLGSAFVFLGKRTGVLEHLDLALFLRRVVRRSVRTSKSVGMNVWGVLRNILRAVHVFSTKLTNCGKELIWQFVSYTPTKAALEIKLEKEKASTLCIVCMDRRRDVMILNCRHMLMCRQCALTVAVGSGDCPACRLPIDNIISVYT